MYNNNKYHTKGAGSILACEIFNKYMASVLSLLSTMDWLTCSWAGGWADPIFARHVVAIQGLGAAPGLGAANFGAFIVGLTIIGEGEHTWISTDSGAGP